MEPHGLIPTTGHGTGAASTPAAAWRTSSLCAGPSDNCVEVAIEPGEVRVRDSKHPDGPTLRFTVGEWTAFLQGAGRGEFKPPA